MTIKLVWTSMTAGLTMLAPALAGLSCQPTGGLTNQALYAPLVLKVEVDRTWARVGEPVQVRFTTTNDGKQPLVIETKDLPVLDIQIADVDRRQVLFSSVKRNPVNASRRLEWKPGESKVLESVWIAPQEEFGRLVDIGGFLSDDSRVVQSVGVQMYVGYQTGP